MELNRDSAADFCFDAFPRCEAVSTPRIKSEGMPTDQVRGNASLEKHSVVQRVVTGLIAAVAD
jgi:hypothetical protein